jgi:hypothetical protein
LPRAVCARMWTRQRQHGRIARRIRLRGGNKISTTRRRTRGRRSTPGHAGRSAITGPPPRRGRDRWPAASTPRSGRPGRRRSGGVDHQIEPLCHVIAEVLRRLLITIEGQSSGWAGALAETGGECPDGGVTMSGSCPVPSSGTAPTSRMHPKRRGTPARDNGRAVAWTPTAAPSAPKPR